MSESNNLTFLSYITTGPLPYDDSVLETAFVRMAGKEEAGLESFTADPDHIPLAIQKLTGLSKDRTAGKDGPRRTLEKMLKALGEAPVVVHDSTTFIRFLEALNLHPPDRIIDSCELAEIVLPSESDYTLIAVADHLGLDKPWLHRGIDLARLTYKLWETLLGKAHDLSQPVLKALSELAQSAQSPLTPALNQAVNDALGFELSATPHDTLGLGQGFTDYSELHNKAQKCESPEPGNEPLDVVKICAMFRKEGAIGRNLDNFEPRQEQIDMAASVCEALNQGKHLMCEAGTGTGKSMAYLIPAIAWARQNDDKIIVSTNTKNLQEQLYEKDLPFLIRLLGERFKTALLKGRQNYLCIRRFLQLIENSKFELSDPEEYAALMPLVNWAMATKTGDLSDCNGFLQHQKAPSLIPMITASGDECAGRNCHFFDKCFIRRARTLAQLADLIVVNHALAFADVVLDRPYLPRERCIIFDEAHNIEDVATDAASVTSDALSFYRVCRRLWRERRDGNDAGMVASALKLITGSFPVKGPLARDTGIEMANGVIESVEQLGDVARNFYDRLSEPFDIRPTGEDRIMLDECKPPINTEGVIGEAAAELIKIARLLAGRIKNLIECFEAHEADIDRAAEVVRDLTGQQNRVLEAVESLEFILKRENEEYVYWLQRIRRGKRYFYGLQAAPLYIGDFMRTFFFNEMRSVILTSATLRVNRQFEYIKERLGAVNMNEDRLMCAEFGSPFDYEHQSLLCVPTFLPDAGGRRDMTYDEELSSFLIELLRSTAGRSLILFTSYSLLNTVYDRIKRPLEAVSVPLLAQGRDGSRRTLTKLFKENVGSVLLGTQSFWEGVDVLGESLSCLVLTKLPFHVFTDPLVRGRIDYLREKEIDPFRHYTLPQAVITFRQGFGRLIRHRTDRGIVVVTDKRLVSKSYGRCFLNDIPTRHKVYKNRDALIWDAKKFLKH